MTWVGRVLISVADFLVDTNAQSHSRITDLDVVIIDGTAHLFSATRYDGVLRHWQLSETGLGLGDTISFDGALFAGGKGSLVSFTTGTETCLLSGGGNDGDQQLSQILQDGSPGSTIDLQSLPDDFGSFQNTVAHTIADTTYVYGSLVSQAGIGRITFDGTGGLAGWDILTDPAIETMAQITAASVAAVAGQTYLVTASNLQNGIAARSIAADGTLGAPNVFGIDDGLWISAPTVLETAKVNGKTYVILGSAGSQSLSVVELTDDGSMVFRDQILDTRDTRFGDVTALTVTEKDGKTFVIAGGADDGVSVFILLDGGILIHLAAFADTDDIALANVSAIAAHPLLTTDGIDVFVASGSEAGVTHLRLASGAMGVDAVAPTIGGTLIGTSGFDILQGRDGQDILSGGGGDDILQDGAGSDVLAGGIGADIFLLSSDGAQDTITDFEPGVDRLDLSLWPLLRDIDQLTFRLREDGMEILYGHEVLIVQSADGDPIDYRTLQTDNLIGASRLTDAPQPGFPGPPTPTPDPDGADATEPPIAPFYPLIPHGALASNAFAELQDILGGTADTPLLDGTMIGQLLVGSANDDLIIAKAGDDTIDASTGDDLVFGGDGNDRILGGDGADRLLGGKGDDFLTGGAGDDVLTGGFGTDRFVFNAGHDVITDFTPGVDEIQLDARLWTGLTSGADLLLLYASTTSEGTVINFDTGDSLTLPDIFDQAAFADDIILF